MRNIYALFLIIAISGMLLVGSVAPALAQKDFDGLKMGLCKGVGKQLDGTIKWMNPSKSMGQTNESSGMTMTQYRDTFPESPSHFVTVKIHFMFQIPDGLFDKSWKPSIGNNVTYCDGPNSIMNCNCHQAYEVQLKK